MFRKYKELFGNETDSDIVWFAPSRTMNPQIPQRAVDAAMAQDPQRFAPEYLNKWRDDRSDTFPADVIEACTDDIYERPPQPFHFIFSLFR